MPPDKGVINELQRKLLMKKILVPIDFSDNSKIALSTAKRTAVRIDAAITVMHAYQKFIPVATVPESVTSLSIFKEMEKELKHQLNEVVETLRSEGLQAEELWADDATPDAIVKAASQINADLIILGRTGKGGFLDKLIGSSATRVAMDAPCPVLIVPPQFTSKKLSEVVYATQLEYEERDILEKVIPLISSLGGRLTFLKINSLMQADLHDDEPLIQGIIDQFGFEREDIVIKRSGSVARGIEDFCDQIKADLLIVSARKREFLEELLGDNSVTKKLILETKVPLLVYHLDIHKK